MSEECFNPCFSGSCSRIPVPAWIRDELNLVSILVLVDLAREFAMVSISMTAQDVSILVLVDLARESGASVSSMVSSSCFNPCFSGSCSRILFQIMNMN